MKTTNNQTKKSNLMLIYSQVSSLRYKILLIIAIMFMISCNNRHNDTVCVPDTDCEEIKDLQYSVIDGYHYLVSVLTDTKFMFYTEDSSPASGVNLVCCVRRLKIDTIPTCIPCKSLVKFANSQFENCNLRK